jgi:uncharacterized surface protein with fasciclin (FAS1) repeats
MQLRSKLSLYAAVAALATTGLAACGEDEDGEAGASAPPATSQPAEPAEEMAADQNIVELAQDTPQLSTLVDAVVAADLAETLQGEGPYTVFAPTNEAFNELGDDTLQTLLEPENREQLQEILTYHVVPAEAMAADLSDGQELETVNGETLTVSIDGDQVMVGDATVEMADVDASNGVVHVIDTVLQP